MNLPLTVCHKCKFTSGDDWKQCRGECPMPGSPHFTSGESAMSDHVSEGWYQDHYGDDSEGFLRCLIREPPPATTWTTRDGRALVIAEMDSLHLDNCKRMMDRAYASDPDIDIKASPAYRGVELELIKRKGNGT